MVASNKKLQLLKQDMLKGLPAKQHDMAAFFFDQIFSRTEIEDFKLVDETVLSEIIANAWKFFHNRKPGETKINIYEKKISKGRKKTRLVMDIVNDNMPFLVDSFVGYLSQYGLRPKVLVRPVITVKRKDNGDLTEIHSGDYSDPSYKSESIIHCEISDPVMKDLKIKIEKDLPLIFENVECAVHDWRLIRSKIQEAIADSRPILSVLEAAQVAELIDFLQWIDNDHFTFLGYREYDLSSKDKFLKSASTGLGILKLVSNKEVGLLYHGIPLTSEALHYVFEKEPIVVTKTAVKSKVHRVVPLDSITVKKFDDHGNVVGLRQFIGLFTSMAYSSSARDIPLLRRKVMEVVQKSGFSPDWHDGKALIHILDTLPRDELFQATVDDLHDLCIRVLAIQETQKVCLFLRRDKFDRFLSCMVYIPRDRFEYELIEEIRDILVQSLKAEVTLSSAQYGDLPFARIHYMADKIKDHSVHFDINKIEKKIALVSRSWTDTLKNVINESFDESESLNLIKRYQKAFNKGYQERFSEETAVVDIHYLEDILKSKGIKARLYRPESSALDTLKLKMFNYKDPIHLADIMPILENLDLRVNTEIPFPVKLNGCVDPLWIHDFDMESLGKQPIDLYKVNDNFLATLYKVWNGEIENDAFNRLVIRAGLNWRQCLVFRAYARYFKQLQRPFSQSYLAETLTKNPLISAKLIELFETRLNPSMAKKKVSEEAIMAQITEMLTEVTNPEEDRILNFFINIITSTIRTNFYQTDINGEHKTCVSFKFDSRKIEDMPLPCPKYDIFVYSTRFEAVHLRAGEIARGGIRWSDRREDFRIEILGLLKAQMVKNAVIVPAGSKGGFVIKTDTQYMTREELQAEGIACYKEMIIAMLDITDNLVRNKIVHPKGMVIKDGNDPYLVVAADKGTATFSDFANEISEARNFWLADAFASGGSYGYDHKKMGITAKGAWESVRRHFYEMGIDADTEEISVIGVGDMAGDVFGNGMILSKHLKLLAAFNHKNIFIDPNPDPEKSFKERKRLFDHVKGWDEYDKTLISKGGGVYDRSEKTLSISDEAKNLLGLSKKNISPNELMHAILKAKADLLWFGGIGTYVKARTETQLEVGDRANESIRVNAFELNCKVIGEGANLGVTQRGRIEFARNGGCINTDAIDNSAGVDCSDHEVNIKILLQEVVEKGDLDFAQRNKLLVNMTHDVSRLVLRTNCQQNLALSLMCYEAPQLIDTQIKLIHALEKEGRLDRGLEFIPDDTILYDLQASQQGLTRPEIAVLLPYAKNSLYDKIIATDFCDLPIAQPKLYKYFPTVLQEKYKKEIDNHPLRREIIATIVANEIVNRMGGSFENELMESTGQPLENVLKAYFLATSIFGFDDLWTRVDVVTGLSAKNQLHLFLVLWKLINRVTEWFLKYLDTPIDVDFVTTVFNKGLADLRTDISGCIVGEMAVRQTELVTEYKVLGLPDDLATDLSLMDIMVSSPDIIMIADTLHIPVSTVAGIYFGIDEKFAFTKLHEIADSMAVSTYWQRKALSGLNDDLYLLQSTITTNVAEYLSSKKIKKNATPAETIEAWAQERQQIIYIIEQQLHEAINQIMPDVALLSVVTKTLSNLAYE